MRKVISRNKSLGYRGLGSLMFALALSATATAAEPTMFLESSGIDGTASTIRVTRVPVRDLAGKITYKTITVPFIVSSTGAVTLNAAGVSIVASPTLVTGTFKPGTYNGVNGYDFIVGSPGPGSGGRVTSSIQGSTYAFNATWVSGPIVGHPYEAALAAAGITSTAQTWGIMGNVGFNVFAYTGWDAGDIIGAVQTGNQITLTNYGADNIPDTTLTFTLCPTSAFC